MGSHEKMNRRSEPREMKALRAQIRVAMALPIIAAILRMAGWSQAPQVVTTSQPLAFPDVVTNVGKSVVMVEVSVSYKVQIPSAVEGQPGSVKDENGTAGGTGFIFDNEWHVVTADHVVNSEMIGASINAQLAGGRTIQPGSLHVDEISVNSFVPNSDDSNGFITYNTRAPFKADLLKEDKLRDIAILNVPLLLSRFKAQCTLYHRCDGLTFFGDISRGHTPNIKIAELENQLPRSGDQVSVTGFPAFQDFGGQIPGLTTDSGRISNAYILLAEGFKVYAANLKVNHGDSGAPLFNDRDGHVLGFVDRFLTAQEGGNSGETVIVPIGAVLDLLARP